eukprot:CAMPEP_0115373802 /NCGR_PEP_ID=MMETSP0271-20121206/1623_1 /TAXON_ID=71861 /ORGANISM="Scrippsiella trochoidea, Strain CCMP3099" /LENGTH=374 /DNA_ID=CAMNT_0002796823 /DNA_START=42 /DNA_END=1166 /DNA_ORIENTATION=+
MKRSSRCLGASALIALAPAIWLYPYAEHLSTSIKAIYTLATMPSEDITNFFKSYEVLEKMGTDARFGVKDEADAKAIHDLYKVLNQICAAGVVMEIMTLPPVLDRRATLMENQYLWLDRVVEHMKLQPGERMLDMGSGRGKAAAYISERTGAGVIQINIDETQIEFGKELAKAKGIYDRMEFHTQDFNLPKPYIADNSLGGLLCHQACVFVANKTKHLKEMYRLIKPGGHVVQLEWLTKDFGDRPDIGETGRYGKFDFGNATHRELVRKMGVLFGGSFPSGVLEWEAAFKEAGFELLLSHDPGEIPSILMFDAANNAYEPLGNAIIWLAGIGLLPKHLGELFVRLRTYYEASREAYQMDLATLSWEFIARKPLA